MNTMVNRQPDCAQESKNAEIADKLRGLPAQSSRRTMFLRYILVYLALAAVLVGLAAPIYRTAIGVVNDNVKKDFEIIAHEGVRRLEKSFETVMRVDYSIVASDYLTVKQLRDFQFDAPNTARLINAKKMFASYVGSVDMAADVYAVFRKNNKVISKNSIYMDSGEFFDQFMVYGDTPAGDMRAQILDTGTPYGFIPATGILSDYLNSNAPVDCLTFVARNSGSPVSVCAVYRMDDIAALFHQNARFSISAADGTLLAGAPADPDNEHVIYDGALSAVGARISVRVPNSYFAERARPLNSLIRLYVILMAAVGLALALSLALYTYLPLYRLVKANFGEYTVIRGTDEFRLLRGLAEQSNLAIRDLRGALRDMEAYLKESTLMNALYAGSVAEQSPEAVAELLEQFNLPCRLALVRLRAGVGEGTCRLAAATAYAALEGRGLSAVRIAPGQLAVLFANSGCREFEDGVRELASMARERFGAVLGAVVSEVFHGAHNACQAYQRLQSAAGGEECIRYLSDDEGQASRGCARRRMQAVNQLNTVMRQGGAEQAAQIVRDAAASLSA